MAHRILHNQAPEVLLLIYKKTTYNTNNYECIAFHEVAELVSAEVSDYEFNFFYQHFLSRVCCTRFVQCNLLDWRCLQAIASTQGFTQCALEGQRSRVFSSKKKKANYECIDRTGFLIEEEAPPQELDYEEYVYNFLQVFDQGKYLRYLKVYGL